jgi:hypothetical protein
MTRNLYIAIGAAVVVTAALTTLLTRRKGRFHGDVDAVRAANELNPHSRIYNGGPAVAPARA